MGTKNKNSKVIDKQKVTSKFADINENITKTVLKY